MRNDRLLKLEGLLQTHRFKFAIWECFMSNNGGGVLYHDSTVLSN